MQGKIADVRYKIGEMEGQRPREGGGGKALSWIDFEVCYITMKIFV